MNSFAFENERFLYRKDSGEVTVLLDCNDFLYNKSRMPFHTLENDLTAPNMLVSLINEHIQHCEDAEQREFAAYYGLLDTLIVHFHVRTSAPKRILELGCDNGVMSYHLATILGRLHPESLLYSVSNVMGNESGNRWMDSIMRVEKLPQLGFAAVDYHDTNLRDGNFDIVIINGSVPVEQPDLVLEEARRVTRGGGLVIAFAQNQPLVESAFKLVFDEYEEYFFNYRGRILTAEV